MLLDLFARCARSPEKRVVIRVTRFALTLSLPCWRFIMKPFVFGHFLDSLPSILDECLLLAVLPALCIMWVCLCCAAALVSR